MFHLWRAENFAVPTDTIWTFGGTLKIFLEEKKRFQIKKRFGNFIQPFIFPPLILSIPTSACTIVSDPSCTRVHSIMCDDVPPSSECEVHLRRTFPEPGTYCVNITLEDSRSLALTTTTVTINKSQDTPGRLHEDIHSHNPCMFPNFLKRGLIL